MAINSFDPELHFSLLANEGGAQLRAGISHMQKKSKSRGTEGKYVGGGRTL